MKVFLACLLLLALGVKCASATCIAGMPTIVPYKWSPKLFAYCEYHGMKFMNGSKWVDAERCQSCTCHGGLSCCGIGYYAGVMDAGDSCTVVPDHCDAVILNKEKTALCHPK